MTKLIVAFHNFATAPKKTAQITVLRTIIISRELGIRKAIAVSGFKRLHFHFNKHRIVIGHTVLGTRVSTCGRIASSFIPNLVTCPQNGSPALSQTLLV